jgi:hypothetical protein
MKIPDSFDHDRDWSTMTVFFFVVFFSVSVFQITPMFGLMLFDFQTLTTLYFGLYCWIGVVIGKIFFNGTSLQSLDDLIKRGFIFGIPIISSIISLSVMILVYFLKKRMRPNSSSTLTK